MTLDIQLEFENFICEPYSTNEHRVHLFRFDAMELIDEQGNSYIPQGLQDSIRNDLADLDNSNMLKTFLVYGKSFNSELNKTVKELACVFSLRCSSMNFNDNVSEVPFNEIIPAIELVYLAIDNNYRLKHSETKGLGSFVFDVFIVPIIQTIGKLTGCKNLFLFAINNKKLIDYYISKMDFLELPSEQEKSVVNNLVTKYNEKCKFLYQPLDNL